MGYTDEQLNAVYDKTDDHCHLCEKKIAWCNYGIFGNREAWEVDHSVAIANGGRHHHKNWMPACISCNRRKQAGSTRSLRAANGLRRAPMSKNKNNQLRQEKMVDLGVGFGIAGLAMGGPIGAAIAGLIGAATGSEWDPEGDE